MVVTFRLKPTSDRSDGPLECIGETVGTTPTPAVLYINILAQVRSIEHDSWLSGVKLVKCAFIVGHLAKNEAVQKCYITGKTYTAVLVGHVRTAWTQQTLL